MPYVVTQSCCADASCVVACPVNCIHPAPGEPGFGTTEMLHVDPDSCVDCGACATACPVDAVVPHTALTPAQLPFAELNAGYYDTFPHRDRTPVAVVPPQRRVTRRGPFRVAVVGAGPAGLYAADELLRHPEVQVDVYDRLPTPYGLVRAGVAPDHPETKRVTRLFRAIEGQPGFRYRLGVDVGRDVTLADLQRHHHAVVYAVGAASDRRLGLPGEDLDGSWSATDLVAWYNGHPDRRHLQVSLDHERVVVVGNGNVALDVARVLTADPAALAHTDVARHALDVLSRSRVREVVVLGRRGPEHAAFTLPELIGLAGRDDVDVVVESDQPIPEDSQALRLLASLARRTPRTARRVVLRFRATPAAIVGEDRVAAVELASGERIATGAVVRAVGYRGRPVRDLPYDEATGTVPHDAGRVRPGVYVAGWVKRGPSGFIGSNKACAQETVSSLLDDLDGGLLPDPEGTPRDLATLLDRRTPGVVDLAGWHAIQAVEQRDGKLVDPAELLRVAHAGGRRGYAGRRRGGVGRRPSRR